MKKSLLVLLALAVTAGAQAQIGVSGQIHTNLGVRFRGGDGIFMQGNTLQTFHEFARPAQWDFTFLGPNTHFEVNVAGEVAGGFLRVRTGPFNAAGMFRGYFYVNLVGGHELGIGFTELPWVQWSPITFDGDNNAGVGAAASTVNPFVIGHFAVAPGMTVYAGLSEAGRTGATAGVAGAGAGIGGVWNMSSPDDDVTWSSPTPGFFAGFEMTEPDFVAGLALAGVPTSTTGGADGIFAWMASVYGRLLGIGPTEQIGVNVAIYGDPMYGFFAVAHSGAATHLQQVARGVSASPWMMLEAMVNATFPFDFGTAAFSYGVLLPFDGDTELLGQQVAAQVTIPLGGGFSLIPGVRYRHENDHFGNARSQTDIGVHMRFNF
ncbi:MAG: hypothetical protein FWG66_13890 [Spirochaetes bacterium]|nr:hypothetical protein [Spirochaetota bacterium]